MADNKSPSKSPGPDREPDSKARSPTASPDPATEGNPLTALGPSTASPSSRVEDILPPSHWTALPEVDDSDTDADSALGADGASSTASITSSVRDYRTVNGRTLHAERGNAGYWAFNDEPQLEAMDLNAHLCFLALGRKLHRAPLEEKTLNKVLDIGTGTGIWAIDFADHYPSCEVIGTDVSPVQPVWIPPNLKFEIEDCTEPWTYPADTFDYVHMRNLFGSIADWDALFAEAYRVCKPGGWIETHETSPIMESDDNTVKPGSAMAQWGPIYIGGGRKIGRPFDVIQQGIQTRALEKLGMEAIEELKIKTPIGNWPKNEDLQEIGAVAKQTILQDPEGWVTLMASKLHGWTADEIRVYCAHLRSEHKNRGVHPWFWQKVVWARKPVA